MYGEASFVTKKKNVTKVQNQDLLRGGNQKTIHVVVTNNFPAKNMRAQRSVNKVILTRFRDMKGRISVDFLEKAGTVKSSYNYQLLRLNSPHLLNDPHLHTHTHTHTYIYIYIYRERERASNVD